MRVFRVHTGASHRYGRITVNMQTMLLVLLRCAALALALGLASILKARLLCRLLDAPVQGWRWPLVWAAAAAVAVGHLFTALPQSLEWVELSLGIPAILATCGAVVWWKGFTHDDRVLFRMKKGEKPELPPPG